MKPTITAGTPSVSKATLVPVTESGTITVKFDYEAPPGSYSINPVQLTFDAVAQNPQYTSVVLDTTTVSLPGNPAPTQEGFDGSATVTATVKFTDQAPAFRNERIRITANAGAGDCVQAAESVPRDVVLDVGFYEKYTVSLDRLNVKTGQNAAVPLTLQVQNFGNADIQVDVKHDERFSGELRMPLPAPTIVRSLVSGGATDQAQIGLEVRTPFKNGYENRFDDVVLTVGGTAADNRNVQLSTFSVSALIQTQGVFVPGFEALALIGAAAGLLLLAHRRR